MHKLFKPDGTPIEVNDNSLEYALSLGWTKKKPTTKSGKQKPRDKD